MPWICVYLSNSNFRNESRNSEKLDPMNQLQAICIFTIMCWTTHDSLTHFDFKRLPLRWNEFSRRLRTFVFSFININKVKPTNTFDYIPAKCSSELCTFPEPFWAFQNTIFFVEHWCSGFWPRSTSKISKCISTICLITSNVYKLDLSVQKHCFKHLSAWCACL